MYVGYPIRAAELLTLLLHFRKIENCIRYYSIHLRIHEYFKIRS